MFEFMLTRTEMAKLLLSSINCFQLHNLFLLFNSNLYVDFNYTFFEFLLLSITQKCAFTIMQIINVLSEIDFKCQHPIILFMKYSNKLMHELFLIHMFSKSINTIVTLLLFFNLALLFFQPCHLTSNGSSAAILSSGSSLYTNVSKI